MECQGLGDCSFWREVTKNKAGGLEGENPEHPICQVVKKAFLGGLHWAQCVTELSLHCLTYGL